MAKFTVKIDNILGGRTPLNYFGKAGSFKNSLAIDPDLEATTGDNRAGGILTPSPTTALSAVIGSGIDDEPLWMNTVPKDDDVYVYDRAGKIYTVRLTTFAISDLNNGTALSSSTGNGSGYYDNYQYFIKNTDICRYGPLSGARAYNQTYWTSTLSKTVLGNGVTYPAPKIGTSKYPNHVTHRHVDGKFYIADVAASGSPSGKGIIHYIKTSKTTVEGDTNSGSSYNALDLGLGIWPTAIESYGVDLAVAGFEGNTTSGNTVGKRAKIFFWDTTSSSYNKVVELPDPLCSALKNVNGILYTFSGNPGDLGVRVCRFVGGYTFEEIAYLEDSQTPFQGAVDHILNRVLFGGFSASMSGYGSLYALGSKIGNISSGIFNIMRASTPNSSGVAVTSVLVPENTDFVNPTYLIGWRDGGGDSQFGIDRNATTYGVAEFQSEVFRIGKPFIINKIRIPLAQAVASNMTVAVKVIVDQESTTTTVGTINSTNFTGSERFVEFTQAVMGKHDFFIQLSWSGSSLISIGLPIEIEIESIES